MGLSPFGIHIRISDHIAGVAPIQKSIYTDEYNNLLILLVEARKSAGITQAELAGRLQKPQSFISKAESAERRIDAIEFLKIAAAIGTDGLAMLSKIDAKIRNERAT